MFRDRRDAGVRLAAFVRQRVPPPAVVLGIPRGGVIVADEVASILDWPFGVVVTKKLGAPGNPELGIGAVAPGVRVLDRAVIDAMGIRQSWIDRESARVQAEVERRAAAFPGVSALAGRTAVVVDDGVATGGTARAAASWARRAGAARVVLAVPVAPRDIERRMADAFDEVVAVDTPSSFRAVGQFYADFDQVSDSEVREVLEARRA